jgi:putative ABC transport system permease protein
LDDILAPESRLMVLKRLAAQLPFVLSEPVFSSVKRAVGVIRSFDFESATKFLREARRMNMSDLVDSVIREIRHALRRLFRRPAFTAVVVLTLALGIGSTTAMFTVVYDVLIKPLPYPDSEALVSLQFTAPGLPNSPPGVVDSMYFTLRDESRSLEHVGLWVERDLTLARSGDPEKVPGVAVTDGTFQALGVEPAFGRSFTESEYSNNAEGPSPVILSYAYWQRRFGGDESVLGQELSIDMVPSRVVGVMPAGFRFLDMTPQPDVVSPMRINADPSGTFITFRNGLARLRDGVTLEDANADVARILPIWFENWAPSFLRNLVADWQLAPALRPLKDDAVRSVSGMLWLLFGAVSAVLLIACANIANLLLVCADERSHEFAIRKSVGAGRHHIAGNLFLDSLVLGVLGGITGVLLAYGGLNLLSRIAPENLPRIAEISVGLPEVVFACLTVLGSSLLFGLVPAVKHAVSGEAPLGARQRGASGKAERNPTCNALIVVQVSLALMLLVGAGLMLRTFQALSDVEPGFSDPESIQLASVSIPFSMANDGESLIALQRNILDRDE